MINDPLRGTAMRFQRRMIHSAKISLFQVYSIDYLNSR